MENTTPSQVFRSPQQHPNHRRIIFGFIISVVIIIGLLLTLFVVKQQQEVRQRASGPVCPVDGASCSWDATDGAASYHFKVVNVDSGTTIKEGDTSDTSTHFTSMPGQTYTCVVTATNACGTGAQGEGTATCPVLSVTPTPSDTPTPTTMTPTPTPLVCGGQCTTDSDCTGAITSPPGLTMSCVSGVCRNPQCTNDNTCFCGSPTPTPTESLTPTDTVTPTETPTETPTYTVTPSQTVTPSLTQTPTPTSPTQVPGDTATPTTQPTVIVYYSTGTPTTFISPSITLPVTGPGDKFINIGLAAVEVTLVGALILFAL